MNSSDTDASRVILIYKGDISALILFVQHPDGSVCAPTPLPKLSTALEPHAPLQAVIQHPALAVRRVSDALGLPNGLLQAQPGFCEQIETPDGVVTVYLGRFTTLDPPHALLQSKQCRLLTLMELRRQPPAELELLRRAYAAVMEG